MRNLKKLVALIVTIVMMATLAIPAFAAAPADVVGTEYESAVSRLAALGVIKGRPDGTYGADESITRAEFLALVIRALGHEDVAGTAASGAKFSDVPSTHWAAGYISLAVGLGIVKGYTDGRFGVNDPVSFEDAVTMIVRAINGGAKADAEGGYPIGHMLIAKKVGITKDITGVAGKEKASRGVVALMLNNSLMVKHFVPGSTAGTWVQSDEDTDTFLGGLGMKFLTKDAAVVVTQTPASNGVDAGKFVAGGNTYKVVAGTVDPDELLGKKVHLWGKDNNNVILAEVTAGTDVAIKSVTEVVYTDAKVTGVKVKLADNTDKTYKIADEDADAYENLALADIGDVVNDLAGVNADLVDITFSVDGDNLLLANAIKFDTIKVLGAAPIENTVAKFIRLYSGFYIKYNDKAAKKVVIEKDGEAATWSDLKKDDILFIATAGVTDDDSKIDQKYVYIKASSTKVVGTLEQAKDSSSSAAKVRVDGTWYDKTVDATIANFNVASLLGKKVIVALDPAGKAYAVVAETAAPSADKYAVVLASDIVEASSVLTDTVYQVKLLTASGDKVVYNVKYNDNTKGYVDAGGFDNNTTGGDLIRYTLNSDGLVDKIEAIAVADATIDYFDTGKLVLKDTTPETDVLTEVSSDVVMFYKANDGTYSVKSLSDMKKGDATVVSLIKKDGVVVAAIFDKYEASTTDAAYAYVSDYVAIADGAYMVDVITKDGAKTYETKDANVTERGSIVSFKLDGSGKMIDVVKVTAVTTGFVTSVDNLKVKIDTNDDETADETVYFADNALVINDKDGDGAGSEYSKVDMYANMKVEVYKNGAGEAIAVIIIKM